MTDIKVETATAILQNTTPTDGNSIDRGSSLTILQAENQYRSPNENEHVLSAQTRTALANSIWVITRVKFEKQLPLRELGLCLVITKIRWPSWENNSSHQRGYLLIGANKLCRLNQATWTHPVTPRASQITLVTTSPRTDGTHNRSNHSYVWPISSTSMLKHGSSVLGEQNDVAGQLQPIHKSRLGGKLSVHS